MRFLFILLLVMLSSSLAFAEKKAPTTRPVAKKVTKKKASETRRAKRMQKLKKILNVKTKINSLKPHGSGGNPRKNKAAKPAPAGRATAQKKPEFRSQLSASLRKLVVSGDGTKVFGRTSNNRMLLWDLQNNTLVLNQYRSGYFSHAAISPKGSHVILSKGYWRTRFHRLTTKTKKISKLSSSLKYAKSIAFADESRLLVGTSKGLNVVDIIKDKITAKNIVSGQVLHVQRSPNQKLLAVAQKRNIKILSWPNGKVVFTIPLKSKPVLSQFGPDSKTLAVHSENFTISLYQAGKDTAWSLSKTLIGHTKKCKSLSFLSSSRLLSIDRDHAVLWDLKSGHALEAKKRGWSTQWAHIKGFRFIRSSRKSIREIKFKADPSKALKVEALITSVGQFDHRSLIWIPHTKGSAPKKGSNPRKLVVGNKRGEVFLMTFAPSSAKKFTTEKLGDLGKWSAIQSLAVNPKGTLVAAVGIRSKSVTIWDLESKKFRKLTLPKKGQWYLTFANQGKELVVGSERGKILFLDIDTGKTLRTSTTHQYIRGLFSVGSKGQYLLVNSGFSGKALIVHEIASNKIVRVAKQHANIIGAHVESSGRWAVTGVNGGGFRIWNMQTGKEHKRISNGTLGSQCIDPKKRMVAFSNKTGQIQYFDIRSGKKFAEKSGLWNKIENIAFSPDGDFLAGHMGNQIAFFSTPKQSLKPMSTKPFEETKEWRKAKGKFLAGYKTTIKSIALGGASGNKVYIAGRSRILLHVDLNTKAIQADKSRRWGAYRKLVSSSADSSLVVTGGYRGALLLQSEKGKQKLNGFKYLKGLKVSQDGTWIAAGSWKGKIKVFHRSTRGWMQMPFSFKHRYGSDVRSFSFNPTHPLMASVGQDDVIKVWDLTKGTLQWKDKQKDDINKVEYHPAGTEVATVNENGEVIVYDKKGKRKKVYSFWNSQLNGHSLAYRPDGRMLAAGFDDGIIRIIDRKTHTIWLLKFHWTSVQGLLWTPKGKLIAAFDRYLYQMELPKDFPAYTKPVELPGVTIKKVHAGPSQTLTKQNSGKLLAWVQSNQKIKVVDSSTGKEVCLLSNVPATISQLKLHPSQPFLATSDKDGQVIVWSLKSKRRTVLKTKGTLRSMQWKGSFLMLQFEGNKVQLFRMEL